MVTHLNILLGPYCLTSLIWPFTLTAFTFGSCLYCANVSYFKDGWAVNFVFFSQMDNKTPQLNASVMHNTSEQRGQWGWMVRQWASLGQIIEVKQSRPRLILRWVTIWQPHFFQLGKNIRQIRQICKFHRNVKNPLISTRYCRDLRRDSTRFKSNLLNVTHSSTRLWYTQDFPSREHL